jgi:PAS domain S-box-containing protein
MPPLTLHQHEHLWAVSETPLALVDLDNRFVRCNHSFCSIVGYSESELQLRRWTDITHPDDVAGDIASTITLRADTESNGYGITKRYLTKDGRVVFVRLSVLAVRNDTGAVIGYYVTANLLAREHQGSVKSEPFSLLRWATRNPKDAAIIGLGGGLLLGRDTIIELLRLWLKD